MKPGATGKFPEGKLGKFDEGQIAIAIFNDEAKKVVVMDFGKSVKWLAMDATLAREMANQLRKNADLLDLATGN